MDVWRSPLVLLDSTFKSRSARLLVVVLFCPPELHQNLVLRLHTDQQLVPHGLLRREDPCDSAVEVHILGLLVLRLDLLDGENVDRLFSAERRALEHH